MNQFSLDQVPNIPADVLVGMISHTGPFLVWQDADGVQHMGDFACPEKPKGTAALGELCVGCRALAGCQVDRAELNAPLVVTAAFTLGMNHPIILDRVESSGGLVFDNTDPAWF